jgi:hypothetical protein
MLKKSVQDFFSSFRRGACPRLAPFFKHLRVRKMAVDPSTAPQVAEKLVFQQPAREKRIRSPDFPYGRV